MEVVDFSPLPSLPRWIPAFALTTPNADETECKSLKTTGMNPVADKNNRPLVAIGGKTRGIGMSRFQGENDLTTKLIDP
jgi:hypothetical protein